MFEEMLSEGKVRLPVANPTESVTHVEVEVDYDRGGHSAWPNTTGRRGVYLYVRPVGVGERDGISFVSVGLFRGYKSLLEETRRASPRKLAVWRGVARDSLVVKTGAVWELVLKVCGEEKLELAPRDAEEAIHREAVKDKVAALVYADWLEERGRYDEAREWREKVQAAGVA